jgi:hypothetical protein
MNAPVLPVTPTDTVPPEGDPAICKSTSSTYEDAGRVVTLMALAVAPETPIR